jgi:NADPH:quinone reductase-like Zn-dependent oxidoreductase
MKAIAQDRYGPPEVLRLDEVDKPVIGVGDVLVRVRAAGVNPLDWHYMRGAPFVGRIGMGLARPSPRIRGVDVAGTIDAVGKEVKDLRPGDQVFGWCAGAFAQYAAAGEDHFVTIPSGTSHEEAAALPVAAVTALQALRDFGKLRSGQRVLINGAAGGVGTYAVQIAKSMGAEVTGVCSAGNVELVMSLGADHAIDYSTEDFTKRPERYDVILDNAASHPLSATRSVLVAGGILVLNSGASMGGIAMAQLLSRTGRNVFTFLARLNHDDLTLVRDLVADGKVRSVIDRTYPLEEAGAAIGYVEQGHARGKVVVTV